jgi:hypothetical protein
MIGCWFVIGKENGKMMERSFQNGIYYNFNLKY